MPRVDLEWSHSMAHALALDTRTWPRGDVPDLELTDEDVGLLRESGCNIPAQGLTGLIGYSYQQVVIFFRKPSPKNSKVKRAWHRAILG
jgi:hypothetical protein